MTSLMLPHAQCGTDESDVHDKPSSACLAIQYVLAKGAYAPFLRDHVVQAQYFKVRVFSNDCSVRTLPPTVAAGDGDLR